MAKNQGFSAEADAALKSSYDGLAVHEKMIKDDIRTRSYLDAMQNNPELFQNKVVLDAGCGTGILSMFAVRAGAKHVYAVDVSSMIEKASEIARVNGMSDKITFIQGKVEETELPAVDIIVSEWMGFCLFSEFTLDCVLHARDRYLVPGGLIMPDKTSLHFAAIEDAQAREAKIDYWDNVYGLDFSPVKPSLFTIGFLGTASASNVITKPACLIDLDLQTIKLSDRMFESIPFKLVANRKGKVHAFLVWFDYEFTAGQQKVKISTGPFSPPTHWKQSVFHIKTPVTLEKDEIITGRVSFEQHERDLNVKFTYEVESQNISGSGLYKVDFIE